MEKNESMGASGENWGSLLRPLRMWEVWRAGLGIPVGVLSGDQDNVEKWGWIGRVSLGKEWGHGGDRGSWGDLGGSLLESLEKWGVLSKGMGLVGVPGELWATGWSSGGAVPAAVC